MAPRDPKTTTLSRYPHPVAFRIQLRRNVVVQALGMAMVSLLGLTILPWPAVLAWTLAAMAAVATENRLLQVLASGGRYARAAHLWAPPLRILTTTVYAAAALALIVKGGPGVRMFAFALMSTSMVHVLMRYYRSPPILLASLTPYLLVLGMVGFDLARASFQQGHVVGVMASIFTVAMFAVQFWSARAQLAGAWDELMSARLAAEERERAAEAASLAKSQFLATMSHELRTPLNGVLGMAQALSADRLTRDQRDRVKIIRRSSESLLSVLNDLLDLSRVETGALMLEMAEFDLEHLVRGVVAAHQPLAATKGLGFAFEIEADAAGRYVGDSARIRRILYSLCDNAVKFTPTGGVTLSVGREAVGVVFRVTDTGVGIAKDDVEHLFEGFFQADSTLTRRYDGAGIGLAICRQLTSLMGGAIEAASELGNGSTFTLRLPLESATSLAEPAADEGPPAIEQPAELRVLAAEDNATNQLVLKTLLAQAGIVPTFVVNGREALAAWKDQTWDIVLMDIQMPEMNGIEATRAIRQRELETGRTRTPIVAVTANAMAHQLIEYRAAGIDAMIAKPISLTNLFQVMEQALADTDAAPGEGGRIVDVKASAALNLQR